MEEKIENKTYPDWDGIVIQLNQGDNHVLNIKMMRQDIEVLMNIHEQPRKDILELLVQTLEDQINNPVTDSEE